MSHIEALPVVVVTETEDDEVVYYAECPHCKGRDAFREIDVAIRWNIGELVIENGRIVAADWGTGDADFDHDRYECEHCDGPVLLPDDIDQNYS